jgi:hypothetical protein
MCIESELLEVKVPIIFLGTGGFLATQGWTLDPLLASGICLRNWGASVKTLISGSGVLPHHHYSNNSYYLYHLKNIKNLLNIISLAFI